MMNASGVDYQPGQERRICVEAPLCGGITAPEDVSVTCDLIYGAMSLEYVLQSHFLPGVDGFPGWLTRWSPPEGLVSFLAQC